VLKGLGDEGSDDTAACGRKKEIAITGERSVLAGKTWMQVDSGCACVIRECKQCERGSEVVEELVNE